MKLWYLKLGDLSYFPETGCFFLFAGLIKWEKWKAPRFIEISFSSFPPSNAAIFTLAID